MKWGCRYKFQCLPKIPLKLDTKNYKKLLYGYWVGITPPLPSTCPTTHLLHLGIKKTYVHLFEDGKLIFALFNKIFVQWKNEHHEFHSLNWCPLSYIDYHMTILYGFLLNLRTFCNSQRASNKINVSTGLLSAFYYCSASVRSKLVINVNIFINN